MIPGLVIGELLWLACAALGAAGLARQHAVAFTAVKYLGAAYLVYFAWRTWHSSRFDQTVLPTRTGASRMTVMSGLALSLGNPKTMLFYLAILPSVIDLHATSPVELGILELAAACTTLCIYLLYTFATARVRVAFRSPKSMAAFRIGAAICMVLAAALVVVR
jgi:threonine/homoserine/homoserine lactone efflux protein